ncbi:MAG: hypothetical protein LAO23_22210, partial [Acidobacteriia bacterium]|nr:hypothetical protein [Terriglobia bacterium]
TQTPSLAPRAPPSRLNPEMEQKKVVVFLREREQGAGHAGQGIPSFGRIFGSVFENAGIEMTKIDF